MMIQNPHCKLCLSKHQLYFRYADHGTPFDSALDDTVIEEDILASENDASGYFTEDSEEESEELRKDYVDEYGDDISSSRYILMFVFHDVIIINNFQSV